MDRMDEETRIRFGTPVVDSTGHRIGDVDEVQDGYIVVRKGTFFPKNYPIPLSAIASHDDDIITLNLTRHEFDSQNWHGQGKDDLDFNEDGKMIVPVAQEELVATPRQVLRGTVRIDTKIFEQEQEIDVPVTEERVRIERRVMDRDAAGNEITIDGGTFEIPFYGEDVDLDAHVRVIEEIVITREAIETVRRVRGVARREEVTVDESNVQEPKGDPESSNANMTDRP